MHLHWSYSGSCSRALEGLKHRIATFVHSEGRDCFLTVFLEVSSGGGDAWQQAKGREETQEE